MAAEYETGPWDKVRAKAAWLDAKPAPWKQQTLFWQALAVAMGRSLIATEHWFLSHGYVAKVHSVEPRRPGYVAKCRALVVPLRCEVESCKRSAKIMGKWCRPCYQKLRRDRPRPGAAIAALETELAEVKRAAREYLRTSSGQSGWNARENLAAMDALQMALGDDAKRMGVRT